MTKIVSIKETSAIFLAIVLVLGTITLSVPSFMTNAQATSDRENDYDNDEEEKDSYDKDRDDKSRDYDKKDYDNDEDQKSYDKDSNYDSKDSSYKDDYKSEYSSYGKDKSKDSSSSIFVKKIKCNNINVNVNGLDFTLGITNNGPITEPIAEAQALDDNDEGTDSFVSNGESRQSDSGTDSRIVCINNNNNIVVGEELPEPLSCEECFTENLDEEQLENLTSVLTLTDVGDLEGLCEALSNSTLTNQEKFNGLAIIFSVAEIIDEDAFFRVLECLEDLGLITLPVED